MGAEPGGRGEAPGQEAACNALVCAARYGSGNALDAHVRMLIDQVLGHNTSHVKELLFNEWRKQYAAAQAQQAAAAGKATSGCLPTVPGAASPQRLPWIQDLLAMLQPGMPQHLTGMSELQGSLAAITMTMALARESAGGTLPKQLMSMLSPFRSQVEELRPLGKGGFGSVVLVRNRLDNKLMAVKQVPFKSPLPPWMAPELLEQRHARLLREVRALASLERSPYIVRYHHAWLEPQWDKIGQALQQHPELQAPSRAHEAPGVAAGAAGAAGVAGLQLSPRPGNGRRQHPESSNGVGRKGSARRGTWQGQAAYANAQDRDRDAGDGGRATAEAGAEAGMTGEAARVAGLAHALGLPNRGLVRQMAAGMAGSGVMPPLLQVPGATGVFVQPGLVSPRAVQHGAVTIAAVPAVPPTVIIQGSSADGEGVGTSVDSGRDSSDVSTSHGSTDDGGKSGDHHHGQFGGGDVVQRLLAGGNGRGLRAGGRSLGMKGLDGRVVTGMGSGSLDESATFEASSTMVSESESERSASDLGATHDGSREDNWGGKWNVKGKQGRRHHHNSASVTARVTVEGSESGKGKGRSNKVSTSSHKRDGRGVGMKGGGILPKTGSWASITRNSAFTFAHDEDETSGAVEGAGRGEDADDSGAWARLPHVPSATVQIVELNEGETSDTTSRTKGGTGTASSTESSTECGSSTGSESSGTASDEGSMTASSSACSRRSANSKSVAGRTSRGGSGSGSGSGSDSGTESELGSSSSSGQSNTSSSDAESEFGLRQELGTAPGSSTPSSTVDRSYSSPDFGSSSIPTAVGSNPIPNLNQGATGRAAAAAAVANPHREIIVAPLRSHSAQLPAQGTALQHPGQAIQLAARRQRRGTRQAAGTGAIVAAQAPAAKRTTGGKGVKWPYCLYIAMEAVPGVTLDVWLQNRARTFLAAPPSSPAATASPPSVPEAQPPGTGSSRRANPCRAGSDAARGDVNSSSDSVGARHGTGHAGCGSCLGPVERDIFRQLALGLLHCHSAGIIHRDLKPSNVFIVPLMAHNDQQHNPQHTATPPRRHSAHGSMHRIAAGDGGSAGSPGTGASRAAGAYTPRVHVKIGDFGLAAGEDLTAGINRGLAAKGLARGGGGAAGGAAMGRQGSASSSSSGMTYTSGVGTASYSAPEQLHGNGQYGPAVDMWPMGLMLVELCCTFTTGMERAMALREARAGRLPPRMLHGMPGEASLARWLLSPDPAARPNAWQLLHSLDRLWNSSNPGNSDASSPGWAANGSRHAGTDHGYVNVNQAWQGNEAGGHGQGHGGGCDMLDHGPNQGPGAAAWLGMNAFGPFIDVQATDVKVKVEEVVGSSAEQPCLARPCCKATAAPSSDKALPHAARCSVASSMGCTGAGDGIGGCPTIPLTIPSIRAMAPLNPVPAVVIELPDSSKSGAGAGAAFTPESSIGRRSISLTRAKSDAAQEVRLLGGSSTDVPPSQAEGSYGAGRCGTRGPGHVPGRGDCSGRADAAKANASAQGAPETILPGLSVSGCHNQGARCGDGLAATAGGSSLLTASVAYGTATTDCTPGEGERPEREEQPLYAYQGKQYSVTQLLQLLHERDARVQLLEQQLAALQQH